MGVDLTGMLSTPTVRGCCRFSGFTPKGGENLFEATTAYPLRVLALPRARGGNISIETK